MVFRIWHETVKTPCFGPGMGHDVCHDSDVSSPQLVLFPSKEVEAGSGRTARVSWTVKFDVIVLT